MADGTGARQPPRRPRLAVLLGVLLLAACVSPLHRADLMAREGGLTPLMLEGAGFRHAAWARVTDGDALLVLFIEGDGTPWVHGGRVIATDPTPHRPTVLELAAGTPGSVLYLGRPCYFATHSDEVCSERWWTSDRYGAKVVESLAAAARGFREAHHLGRILLVGHSGGGTLAVLLARELSGVAGVISIAGNLDPEEWTRQHGYLPLTGSLDPARQPPLPEGLPQWYLLGGKDVVVSESMAARYLIRVPPERIWRYPGFDHGCCWQTVWPGVYARISRELGRQGGR